MHIIATKYNFISVDMSSENFSYNIQSFDRNVEDTAASNQTRTQRNESHHTSPLQFSTEIMNLKERYTAEEISNPFRIATDRSNSADVLNQISPREKMSEDKNIKDEYNPKIGRSHSADLILCFRQDSLNSINIFEG